MKLKLLFTFLLLILLQTSGFGQKTWDGGGDGVNWSSANNWNTNGVPASGDAVIIPAGFTVTVDGNYTCASVTFSGASATLTVNTGNTLVTGVITLNSNASANSAATIAGAGTITATGVNVGTSVTPTSSRSTIMTSTIANFNVTGSLGLVSRRNSGNNNNSTFQLQSGILDIDGQITTTNQASGVTSTFTMNSGTETGTLLLSNASPFVLSANTTNTIDLNGTSSTVNYDGTAQTVFVTAYTNLTLSGSGAKTFAVTSVTNNLILSGTATATVGANLDVGGNLSVDTGTIFTTGNTFTLGVTGTTGVTGTLTLGGTGAKTFTEDVTINSGGAWNETGIAAIGFGGSLTNSGTYTATANTTGIHTFSGAAKTISGSGTNTLTIPVMAVTGSYANNGDLYVTTLSGAGSLTNASPADPTKTFVIQGASSVATLINQGTAIIENSGAISTATFTNTGTLHLNGSGTIASITNSTGGIVNLNNSGAIGSFNNATGTSVLNISALTVPTITTFTINTAGNTVNYSGAGNQIVRTATYSNLTLSGSGAKTFAATTAISRNLSISGSATATFNATGNTAATLTLGGNVQNSGTWGFNIATGATNINTTYFNAPGAPQANKFVTISCTALTAPSPVSSNSRCGVGTVSLAATPGSGQTIDWYAASSGGTALLTGNSSYTTPSIAGTTIYYAEARNTTTGCVSSTRTAVTATVNTAPIVTVDKLTSNICAGQSVTLTAAGDPGNALTMGASSYMQVSGDPLSTTTDFTFETMLYWTNDATNWQRIFDFGANITNNMFFTPRADVGNFPRYAITISGNPGEERIDGNTSITINTWHHLAITYNSATKTGIMYLDGVNIGSNTNMTITPAAITKTASYFGKSQYGVDPNLSGTMDEIRLWNVARSAAEINTYKASTVPLNSTGLVAYYKLNEGTGTVSNSAVGSSSVIVSGSPTWTTSTAPVSSSDGLIPTYSWTPTTGLNTSSGNVVIASPTTTTTYKVTSTYPNTCYATANAVVNVSVITTQPATAGQILCINSTATALTIVASAASGNSISSYQWYSNTTAVASGGTPVGTNSASYTPSTATAGTLYYYCVVAFSSPCTVTSAVSGAITVNALPTVTSTAGNTKTYTGVANTTTVSAVVSSGATIDWYDALSAGNLVGTGSPYAPTGVNVGTYTVYAQARNTTAGCISTSRTAAVLTITQLPVILTGTRAYDGTTNALSTDLTISNNADGGNLILSGTGILAAKDVGTRAISVPATPVRVQSQTGNTGTGAATSFNVTVAAPANGNTLVAVISTRGTAANQVSTITQTGATWNRAAQSTGTSGTTEIWYASNVSGAGTTITINQAASLLSAAVVMEYSGILTPSPLDVIGTNNNTSNNTNASTGTTTTTTQANEVLIGGIGLVSSVYTIGIPTNSFTAVANAASTNATSGNNARVYALERIVSGTGTYSTGGTINTSSRWSGAIATFKAVVPLTLGGSAAGNYTLTGLSGSMIITPKALSITAPSIASKVYDGSAVSGAVTTGTLSGFVGTETVTVTAAAGLYADANAGTGKTATVTYALANGTNGGLATNYSLAGTGTGNITAKALTVTAVTATKTYDGTTSSAASPTVGALVSGDVVNTAPTQVYDNKNFGTTHQLTASGLTIKDGSSVDVTANYTITYAVSPLTGVINKAAVTVTAVTATKTYNGTTSSAASPTVGALVSGDVVNAAPTQVYDNKNYGTTHQLTASGLTIKDGSSVDVTGNYTITYAVSPSTGVINKAAVTVTAVTATKTYDGTTASAGVPTVGALVSGDVVNAAPTQVYDNKNFGTTHQLTASGLTIKDGSSVDVTANYTITYAVSPLTGVINKAAVTVTAVTATKTYNGTTSSAASPTVGALVSGDVVNAAPTQVYDNKNYGTTHQLTASGLTIKDGSSVDVTANYTITYAVSPLTGVINKAAVTVTAVTATKTYDGTTSSAGVPTVGALVSGDVVNAAPTQVYDNKNYGTTHQLTASGLTIKDGSSVDVTGNYTITYAVSPLTGVINKAAVTVTAVTATKTYDGTTASAGVPTVGALVSGDVVNAAPTQVYDNKNFGITHVLTASGLTIKDGSSVDVTGNYTITYAVSPLTGVINKAAVTVTAVTATKTYDGTTSSAASPTVGAFVSGDVVNAAPTQVYDNKNFGITHVLTASGLTIKDGSSVDVTGNYTITYAVSPSTGVINKAAVTVTAVTATKTYDGTTASAGVPTVGALVSGDVVNAAPTQVYDNKNYGTTHQLTASGLTIKDGSSVDVTANYTITYAVSPLTGVINKAAVTVTGATVTTKTYDGTTSATITGAALSGVLAADVANVSLGNDTTGVFDNANVGTGKTVTTAPMTISGTASGNYILTQPTLTGTITKAALTITANAQNKCYGTVLTLGSTAFTTSALQNGETITSVTLTSTGGYDASLTQSAGSYAGDIIPSSPTGVGFSASNYVITMAAGNLTINGLPNNVSNGFSATTMCAGGSPQLTFDAEDSTFSTPYSITYQNDTTLAQFTIAIPNASAYSFTPGDNPTANVGYTLISISNASCARTAPFGDSGANLIVRPIPTAGISGTASVCVGAVSPNITFTNPQSVTIRITYNVNGGGNLTALVATNGSSTTAVSTAVGGSFVYNLVSVAYFDGAPGCTNNAVTGSATVTVNTAPAITTQPSNHPVCETGDTSFTVAATGAGLTYQWQVSTDGGTNFSNLSNTGVYTNTTAATMNITAATTAMSTYQYHCIVSGTCTPAVTSNAAVLTVGADWGGIRFNGGAPLVSNSTVFYCPSTTAKFSISPISGVTQYFWSIPAGWVILSGDQTDTITVMTGHSLANSGSVSVAPINNTFCPSYIKVQLSSAAPAAPTFSKTDATCAAPTGRIDVTLQPSGTVYTLTGTNPVAAAVTNTLGSFSGLAGGDYTIMYQTGSGCVSASTATISIVPLVTNTWNGTAWSTGSAPTLSELVVFDADYLITTATLNACSCTINSGKNVVVGVAGAANADAILKIENGLDVLGSGSLTFENNASLVQVNDYAINHGSITYKRITPGLKDLDYEYWSSPVKLQKLSVLYGSDRYFRFTSGAWEAQGGNITMDEARGYIIRVRTNSPPFYQEVAFKGEPNNGIIKVASQGLNKSNLIGNPYPSAIDAEKFIIDNQPLSGGSLYFWTHFTARQTSTDGKEYKYNADDYAVYSILGSTTTATAALSTNGAGMKPSGEIGAGQAFFVLSDGSGDFKFTNAMRFDENAAVLNNSQFFKPSDTKKTAKIKKDRVWLNLTNDGGAFKQLLVGYAAGATNDFDKLYDGITRNGNAYIDFYSVSNSKNYTIQGRALPFDVADEVPLGYKTTLEGTFQIAIDDVDGGLMNQKIYLEDKLTNTIQDLKSGAYTFTTAIGTFNDRFVLRYTNTSKLGTGDVLPAKGKGFFVSVKNSEIKINSFDQIINSVKVYDLKGSLLYEKNKVDRNEFIIDTLKSSNQFMVVMVQLEDGKWISEEIIFHD